MKKAIYTDFMDSDYKGRLILSSERTFSDLAAKGFWFEEGMTLVFYTEDYDEAGTIGISCAEGVVEYDLDAERWVARIDWNEIKRASELGAGERAQLGF